MTERNVHSRFSQGIPSLPPQISQYVFVGTLLSIALEVPSVVAIETLTGTP